MKQVTGSAGVVLAIVLALAFPSRAAAHCDTLGGPVVADARVALEKGEVTPVLKWVRAQDEGEIRVWFAKTLKVRAQGAEARELADRYFFEALVRIHRAGEGAPYTGLKGAEAVEPILVATDKALESGTSATLAPKLQQDVAQGLHQRFARALAAKQNADDSVAAGREYVQAYIELTHYVEGLHAAARGGAAHGEASEHAH